MTGVVVDSSAIVALVQRESSRLWFQEQLASAASRLMAAPSAVELTIALESRSRSASITGVARRAIRDGRITVIPFDESLADRASDAWRRFGKGRHPAALNFGDCFTYALAEQAGYPILCVGEDFARTDLEVLRPPE